MKLFRVQGMLGDGARFILAGATNTLITLLIYQIALLVVSPMASYSLAWLAGLAFVMIFYPRSVFIGGHQSSFDRLLLAGIYVCMFFVGLLLIYLTTSFIGAPRLAIVLSLLVTTAGNFFLSRRLLRRTSEKPLSSPARPRI